MAEATTLHSADSIARNRRLDIYFGVVAPTGIRRETFESLMKIALKRFGYEMRLWRISELLDDYKGINVNRSDPAEYLRTAMDAGTKLRNEVSKDCLARSVMLSISSLHRKMTAYRNS
jgi:hypothetical protein